MTKDITTRYGVATRRRSPVSVYKPKWAYATHCYDTGYVYMCVRVLFLICEFVVRGGCFVCESKICVKISQKQIVFCIGNRCCGFSPPFGGPLSSFSISIRMIFMFDYKKKHKIHKLLNNSHKYGKISNTNIITMYLKLPTLKNQIQPRSID